MSKKKTDPICQMLLKVLRSDIKAFDHAAVAEGYTRTDPSIPNRTAWAIAVLRTAASQALKIPAVDFPRLPNLRGDDGQDEDAAVKPRSKRATTVRKSPARSV